MNTIKYYALTIAIIIMKPLVTLQKYWDIYSEWRLKMFVRQQVLASYNYDIKAIMALASEKYK